ncbi:hypothetical protein Sp245p_23235 (plasmid) [Azospirillum baldaniorum]|uniref:Uncharacterized protein n=1 Tax=Azospirillum baldaniorum TaxID=1064539 RepID=A0A9P1JZH9_9PROT|nr:hypothetical protein Sp245p_23235 [Azospirillum baldaniorum]CCD02703.1 protein of unknown function [Azospirillum baldaniorum]
MTGHANPRRSPRQPPAFGRLLSCGHGRLPERLSALLIAASSPQTVPDCPSASGGRPRLARSLAHGPTGTTATRMRGKEKRPDRTDRNAAAGLSKGMTR